MGGLAQKATVIDELLDKRINPIILDAGNLFFKNKIIDPGVALERAKIQAEIIVKSFNEIGCNAFSPGENDFAAGLNFFNSLHALSDFDYISCNIYNISTDKALFTPYKIINYNNKKIGVIGLASLFESNEVRILDPIEMLKQTLESINDKTDFNILLFNANDKDLLNLYNLDLNIDLIVRSGSRTKSNDGGNDIPTYSAGDRGKYLYKLNLKYEDKNLPLVDVGWCNNTISRINNRLSKMKKGDINAKLNTLYKDDPATLKRIDNYNYQIEKAENLLSNAVNTIILDKIEMKKDIYGKPSILKIIDEGKLEIQDLIGPEMPDQHGRLPGDPHYNHSH